MGNALRCVSPEKTKKSPSKRSTYFSKFSASIRERSAGFLSSFSGSKKENQESFELDNNLDPEIAEQALQAALLFKQHQKNGTLPFPRSNSVVYPSAASKKHGFTRSSSSRPQFHADLSVRPDQLVNQNEKIIEDVETNHIVLVHGGGFGAWCWYKTITLLAEGGFKVDAVDLTGSGVHPSDSNTITSLSEYAKPLTDIFDKLKEEEKVVLVGHDIGGACISYVMESFPSKISKAVFIAATMLSNSQSALDVFSQQTASNDLMREAQIFLYANGKNSPPTAINLNRTLLKDFLFNQSPSKDVALATVSMRPIPFAPVLEKLSLSDKNYGSIPRFYIKTQEDLAIPVSLQEEMINSNPPKQVFQIKGSDHAPFFSKPQALHRLLVEILQIPSK